MTAGRPTIRFGTDGWRAVIAREYTFANVERVAQAYADYLVSSFKQPLIQQLVDVGQISKEESEDHIFSDVIGSALSTSNPSIIIGYDRRFLSELFAQRAAEVLAGNAFRVSLFSEAVPTPLISWAVKDLNAVGGVVITASHNPPDFNGFKVKAPWGGSATPATTTAIENLVDANPVKRSELTDPGVERLQSAIETYRSQIINYIDIERLKGAAGRLIIDPMHGSAGNWVESFLSGGSLEIETIRSWRDPLFGGVNPEPIDSNLAALKQRVIETGAIAGVATDGDADRLGAVDERGETMTMHEVVPLILLHLVRNRGMNGGVVRTFSQSVLLKRIANAYNLKLHETPIGFKYVAELMLNDDILIGAEESGGIGVKGHIPERDGILNSLLFMEAVITAGKSPSEMVHDIHREFGEFYFGRIDLKSDVERGMRLVGRLGVNAPVSIGGEEVVEVQTLDGTKLIFGDESWLLFRQSGTEPVLRIYSEATSRSKLNSLISAGEKLAQSTQAAS